MAYSLSPSLLNFLHNALNMSTPTELMPLRFAARLFVTSTIANDVKINFALLLKKK